LLSLTHQTVLCVSHDTVFLENICSDVIHYEQRDVWGPYRKLVHYKGKMSEFVKLQPQAKHYFELATSDDMLKFNFPEPGRLDGIKTSTQKFLELENVDFRYPGQDKNQLTDINLKMTLSSRVVILGAVSSLLDFLDCSCCPDGARDSQILSFLYTLCTLRRMEPVKAR